ncbi:O-antigen ligase domain-containing protein [Patescibacteria group bacterium]|nr:MAG: O-antigen ligase domain-containing protein [Patescibacteria group bacterium]
MSSWLLVDNPIFYIAAILYFALFVVLAWKNFRLAVGLFILLLPTYLIRFSLGGIVSTVLEITFLSIFLVWVIHYSRYDLKEIRAFVGRHKYFFVALVLFFLASFVSVFSHEHPFGSDCVWRPYFLEPLLLFFMLIGRGEEIKGPDLINFFAYSTIPISALALLQKFLNWLFPADFWHIPPERVTSFFNSPSAVGLYLGPLIVLMGALLYKKAHLRHILEEEEKIVSPSMWSLPQRKLWRGIKGGTLLLGAAFMLAMLALIFSFSRGAWVALGAGSFFFALLLGWKKAAAVLAGFGLLLFFFAPSLRPSAALSEPAGKTRAILWEYTLHTLAVSPGRLVFGAGLNRLYSQAWNSYFKYKKAEPVVYSHDLLLNFLAETGLAGAVSFVALIVGAFWIVNRKRKDDDIILGAGVMSALTVIVIHGLIDVPYFKSDLAMEFWILMSFMSRSKWISDFTIWTEVNKLMWRKKQPVIVPVLKEPPWING